MDTAQKSRGFLAAWRRIPCSKYTPPYFLKTVLWLFLVGFVLQWFR